MTDPITDDAGESATKATWIYHGRLYHAFVLTHPVTFPVVSACGYHSILTGERKAMGAALCIECATALGQPATKPTPLKWQHNGPQKMGCRECNQSAPPHPDSIGTTPSGLWAPQSAINAMRKKRSNP